MLLRAICVVAVLLVLRERLDRNLAIRVALINVATQLDNLAREQHLGSLIATVGIDEYAAHIADIRLLGRKRDSTP